MKEILAKWLEQEKIFDFRSIVIRGADVESHDAGDIDVLVDHGHSNIACFQFSEYLRANGWLVIDFRELDYLSSVVVANPRMFPGRSVKVDFFGGLGWYGVQSKSTNLTTFALADKAVQQAAITLAHKVMYAGGLVDRDIKRIKPYVNEALKLLHLEALVGEDTFFEKRVPTLLKWKVRFLLSGYSKSSLPFWGLKIVILALRSKLFPTCSKGRCLNIVSSRKTVRSLCDDLYGIYRSSGDARQPNFGSPLLRRMNSLDSMIFNSSSKNYLLKLALTPMFWLIVAFFWVVDGYLNARGVFCISVSHNKRDSFTARSGTYMIDVSELEEDEMLASIVYRIDAMFHKILSEKINVGSQG
ncbi:hypothetical protein N9514_04155 [Pseudomonadales bacterium]|nr:hypothetical protein [Pseudomonadales bacterium]